MISAAVATLSVNWTKRAGSARRAFTLVELLVVITIIGILMGMLLPAVNYAREAGRQAQCKTNLHNLALALQSYDQQNNSFPFGVLANSVSRSKENSWSVSVPRGTALHALLPFLENRSVYDLFYTSKGYVSNPQVPGTDYYVNKHRIAVFVCPSDDYRGSRPGDNVALHNYTPSAGPVKVGVMTHSKGGKECSEASKYNAGLDTLLQRLRSLGRPSGGELRRLADPGPFTVHELSRSPVLNPVTQAMIRDGMSNTIMFGEIRPRCTQEAYWQGWYYTWNGSGIISTLVPINYDSCDPGVPGQATNPCQGANNGSVALGFKSAHPGGAHFAMGDGSVHFFPENIDAWTFNLLGAIDDGLPANVP